MHNFPRVEMLAGDGVHADAHDWGVLGKGKSSSWSLQTLNPLIQPNPGASGRTQHRSV